MIKAIFFDIFGTLVDWRGSLIDQIKQEKIFNKDDLFIEKLVVNWRLEYQPILNKVNNKKTPWMLLDELLLLTLNNTFKKMKVNNVSENKKKKMAFFWHKLKPWNDTNIALTTLNKTYITSSLSNGNIKLQKNLIKYAKLKLNFITSAESFNKYKPDLSVYLGAASSLGLEANECALVASHKSDLKAASKAGFYSIYIKRDKEYGRYSYKFPETSFTPDIVVDNLTNLKDKTIDVKV